MKTLNLKSKFANITAEVRVHFDGSVTVQEYHWDGSPGNKKGFMSVKGARVIYNERQWEVIS